MKFLALQCFSCRSLQVKQAKKTSSKWSCSICNEKQSVRKVFFSSEAAKDVRHFVQQANLARGLSEEAHGSFPSTTKHNSLSCPDDARQGFPNEKREPDQSKWERFLSREDFPDDDEKKDEDDAATKYVISIPDLKPRNPRSRNELSTEVAPNRGACSTKKHPGSMSSESRELKVRDLHSVFSNSKDFGVSDEKDFEFSRENSNFSPRPGWSGSATANGEHIEGASKRGYAILAEEHHIHEESKACKREKPQHQDSKWSKYLERDDG